MTSKRPDYLPYGRQWIDEEDIKEVVDVLKSDWLTTGPKVKEFEDKICEYIGCGYAIAVNSGTSALDIAVQALNLPKGSEIITTPFTFAATSNSILYNNCKPVFADIKRETRNINPQEIRKKITEKTRAITCVDYAGQPCDIREIKEIAKEFNLYMIEDASHAIGAEYNGGKIGSFADLTIFSFHAVKHITTGEGGAVVTDNAELYEKLKVLRNHGIDKDAGERYGKDASYVYDMKFLGRNYRITDFQCALGISQLNKLDGFIDRRRYLANLYNKLLEDVEFIELPYVKENIEHAWHIYTIFLNDRSRNEFFRNMKEGNIGVNVHYIPVYRFSYYKENFNINPMDFPITEEVFSKIITLPLYPKMSDEAVEYVCDKIKS